MEREASCIGTGYHDRNDSEVLSCRGAPIAGFDWDQQAPLSTDGDHAGRAGRVLRNRSLRKRYLVRGCRVVDSLQCRCRAHLGNVGGHDDSEPEEYPGCGSPTGRREAALLVAQGGACSRGGARVATGEDGIDDRGAGPAREGGDVQR